MTRIAGEPISRSQSGPHNTTTGAVGAAGAVAAAPLESPTQLTTLHLILRNPGTKRFTFKLLNEAVTRQFSGEFRRPSVNIERTQSVPRRTPRAGAARDRQLQTQNGWTLSAVTI